MEYIYHPWQIFNVSNTSAQSLVLDSFGEWGNNYMFIWLLYSIYVGVITWSESREPLQLGSITVPYIHDGLDWPVSVHLPAGSRPTTWPSARGRYPSLSYRDSGSPPMHPDAGWTQCSPNHAGSGTWTKRGKGIMCNRFILLCKSQLLYLRYFIRVKKWCLFWSSPHSTWPEEQTPQAESR